MKTNEQSEISDNFTGIAEYPSGTKYWYKEGKLHREDGPACEWTNGHKQWWLEHKKYHPINLNDYLVLDYYKGEYGLMWYRILDKDKVIDCPDILGLIAK